MTEMIETMRERAEGGIAGRPDEVDVAVFLENLRTCVEPSSSTRPTTIGRLEGLLNFVDGYGQ